MYKNLPRKVDNMLHIWAEFNMLAQKYNAINLAHGTPGLTPPEFLLDNMLQAVKDGHNQYTAAMGHPDLREAIVKYYSPRFKPAISRDLNPNNEVLVTVGASSALNNAIHNLCDKGEDVVLFEPFYPNYRSMVQLSKANLKTVPFKTHWTKNNSELEYEYDWDAFENTLGPNTKLIILTNPHNPTGKCLTEEEIKKITEILEKKAPHAYVISDDVYDFLTFDKDYKLFANYGDNWKKTITIYSGGKLMNATGWKIGWSVGPAELIRESALIHESGIFNTNVPGQVALARSFDQLDNPYKGYKSYPEYVSQTFKKTRDGMIDAFTSSNLPLTPTVCEGGYFVMFDASKAKDMIPEQFLTPGNYEDDKDTLVIQRDFKDKVPLDYAFTRWLCITKGITVMPGTSFCVEKPDMIDTFIRVAICKDYDMVKEASRLLSA